MSHVPGGLVYKRFLNILRFANGGPPPPIPIFETFYAFSPNNNPGNDAIVERGNWSAYVTPGAEVLTFSAYADMATPFASPVSLNGINANLIISDIAFTPGTYFQQVRDAGAAGSAFGRFNTTPLPAPTKYLRLSGTASGPADNVIFYVFQFDQPIYGFGIDVTGSRNINPFPGGPGALRFAMTQNINESPSFDWGDSSGYRPADEANRLFAGFVDNQNGYRQVVITMDGNEGEGRNVSRFGIDDVVWLRQDQIQQP